jgi:peptidoglycan hydrolase CwlO-like protein
MPKRFLCAAALILAAASCANPKVQADIMAEVNRAADEINAQRQDMAILQEQIDSLKTVMTRQDSVIKKLANLAGIPGANE